MRPVEELIFVFSADSGILAALADSARKLLALKGCVLCTVTHGLAGEKSEWRACKAELGVPVTYFHRDDVPQAVRDAAGDALPAVVARTGDAYVLLLGPDSIERCNGKVADLRGRLRHQARQRGLDLPLA